MKNFTKLIIAATSSAACITLGGMSAIACEARAPEKYQNPWNVEKFQQVLGKSKLQGLDSSECISNSQLEDGYWASGHFREVSNSVLEFKVDDDAFSRVELRGDSWAGNSTNKTLKAYVNLRGRYNKMADEYTIAQVHVDKHLTNDVPGYPPLRIVFKKSSKYETSDRIGDYRGNGTVYEDYIWAVIRPSSDPDDENLGTADIPIAPAGIFGGYSNRNFIDINYNKNGSKDIEVSVNGVTHTYPMDSWVDSGHYMYHKAGCYTQKDGLCKTQFIVLEY